VVANNKSGAAQRRVRVYESGNLQAAEIILRNPARYQGLMVEWAEMVTARRKKSAVAEEEWLSERRKAS
jgi:hypothetical protein